MHVFSRSVSCADEYILSSAPPPPIRAAFLHFTMDFAETFSNEKSLFGASMVKISAQNIELFWSYSANHGSQGIVRASPLHYELQSSGWF